MTFSSQSIINYKLRRPQTGPGWITRPRLLEHLDRVLQKPVALISAPAGFGKTILLIQWLERCPLPNAYLRLDSYDHEIPTFISGIIAALRQHFPDYLQKTSNLLRAQISVPAEIWLSTLLSDLDQLQDTPFVLALDDYHLVSNPLVDLLLTDILTMEPKSLHLIISARRNPSMSFSRLKAEDKVVEIKTSDLRFTDTEALSYIQQSINVPISIDAVSQLHKKTEGWAAGLTLAAISLRDDAVPEELIANLDRFDRPVSEYLLNQVFNQQTDEIQKFLLKTATFNQFCAAMLTEVLSNDQNEFEYQELLENIEDAQLFLISLDSQRIFFRYHHLFRQMLQSRQVLYLSPDQISLYHQRAAAWYVRQGQVNEALDHLITIKDWTGAAIVVESQFCDLLNADDSLGIIHLLGYLPEDIIATRPALLLMQAWVAHFSLRLMVIHSLIGKIQTFLDSVSQQQVATEGSTPLPGFEIISHRTVQLNIWALQCMILYLTNRGSQAAELARLVLDEMPKNWLFVRGNIMVYLGLSMVMEGQYPQAVNMLTQKYESLQQQRTAFGKRVLFSLAVSHLLQGNLELCRQLAELLVKNAKEMNFLLMLGWGYYLLGRVYQEWNQLDLAAKYYKLVIDMGFNTNLGCSQESIAGYVYVMESLGQHELAQQSFDSLLHLFGAQISATAQPIMALGTWLKLQAGNYTEARRWANSFGTPVTHQAIIWFHIPQIYKIKIQMQINNPEMAAEVDHSLDEVQELAVSTHNIYTQIRTLVMRAFWSARQGKRLLALQTLEQALRLAYPGGFIQSFIEQGPEMLDLLQAVAPKLKKETGLHEYITILIDAFSSPRTLHTTPANLSPLKTLLTERELEVLELLADRLSINEIAARLYISASTVQQHTHHIYRKFNVNNKRQAVASANLLGIIPRKSSP